MITYPLSIQLEIQLYKFRTIFNQSQDQFVIACVGLFLDMWNDSSDDWSPVMNIEPEYEDVTPEHTIVMPKLMEFEFGLFCCVEEFSQMDGINGMIGVVLDYLDRSWDGYDSKTSITYNQDVANMTDQEKRELMFTTNIGGDFNKFFGAQV